MKVSIITICYNNERDIEDTLLSVINQNYTDIEYIVVDGGSTDDTLSLIEKHSSHITKLISEEDNGLYDAINKGLRCATGNIVGLIHAGDRLYSNDTIKKIVEHFNRYNIDISYGNSKIVNEKGQSIRVNKSPEFTRSLVRRGWMPSHQSIYVKTELISKFGYYNLDLHPSSDYEWFLRYFYFNKARIKRLNEYIIYFSLGGISTQSYTSRLKSESKNQIKQCWRINGENPPCGLVYIKLIRKIKQFVLAAFIK
ncbi:glycosyltransferase [Puteibacter caeruleilacunae]|nr:glycosyltransferase [Puteibacter caeruleilacunae]